MPDANLVDEVIAVSTRLINESPHGEIDGKEVAEEIDRSDTDLFWAFQEARRRGALDIEHFGGGMGFPSMIRLPSA